MTLEITHTEFAKTLPESVWKLWSDVSSWSKWDHGVEWCKLKQGHSFQLHSEGTLKPVGSPFPVDIRIVECFENKSFIDEGKIELGLIRFIHKMSSVEGGIRITHSLTFTPKNSEAEKIFKQQMLPKLEQELPKSVKNLATLAENGN